MRVLKSSRWVRGRAVTVASETKRYTQPIELVRKVAVLGFHGPRSFDVASDQVSDDIIVIKGSGSGVNDGVYRVVDSVAVDGGVYRITVEKASFQGGETNGYLIQARQVQIVHGLNADLVDFTLRNELDGCFYHVATKYIDANTLLLMPHTPMEGLFVIAIGA